MTTTPRSQGLAADLMQDLTVTPPAATTPKPGAPVLETALYLSPGGWRRPALVRGRSVVTLHAGPVRISLRRG